MTTIHLNLMNKVHKSIYQNEITADTIKRAPLNIQPMLKIFNDACEHVFRAVGDLEINFQFMHSCKGFHKSLLTISTETKKLLQQSVMQDVSL